MGQSGILKTWNFKIWVEKAERNLGSKVKILEIWGRKLDFCKLKKPQMGIGHVTPLFFLFYFPSSLSSFPHYLLLSLSLHVASPENDSPATRKEHELNDQG